MLHLESLWLVPCLKALWATMKLCSTRHRLIWPISAQTKMCCLFESWFSQQCAQEVQRWVNLTVFCVLIQFAGSFMSGELATQAGYVNWLVLGNTFVLIGVFYVMLVMEQIPPRALESARQQLQPSKEGVTPSTKFSIKATLVEFAKLFRESWSTFTRPRPNRHRTLMWILSMVGFVLMLATNTSGGNYLSRFRIHLRI